MNWHKQLEESIDYIEANLTSTIDLQQLARITHCSAYHYQRVFSFIVGVPLAEYVRRRRMSMAAADLQSGVKVIDVALKYGYNSPDSFARAFKRVHGIAPRDVGAKICTLKSYPRIRFQITTTGDREMEYRIENRDAFRIVGLTRDLPRSMSEIDMQVVPQFWAEAGASGALDTLAGLMGAEPAGFMGVTVGIVAADVDKYITAGDMIVKDEGEDADDTGIQYYIAVASDAAAPVGFAEYEVPALTWAIFSGSGEVNEDSNAVAELGHRIFTEWLPSSGYEYAPGPDIELQTSGSPDDTEFSFEIWVPVKKV